eukprot:181301-Amphidinium_carterae.1
MPSTAILSSACACLYSQRDRRQNAIRKTCDASITPFQPPFRKFQPPFAGFGKVANECIAILPTIITVIIQNTTCKRSRLFREKASAFS